MPRKRGEPQPRIDWPAVDAAIDEALERAENECECQDVRCTCLQHPDAPNGPIRRRERCTRRLNDSHAPGYVVLIPAHFTPDDSVNWLALCGSCNEFRIEADRKAGTYEHGYLHRGVPVSKRLREKVLEPRPSPSR